MDSAPRSGRFARPQAVAASSRQCLRRETKVPGDLAVSRARQLQWGSLRDTAYARLDLGTRPLEASPRATARLADARLSFFSSRSEFDDVLDAGIKLAFRGLQRVSASGRAPRPLPCRLRVRLAPRP